jgi:hypothetical protein
MDRENRIVTILLATLLSACGKRTRAQPPDDGPRVTSAPEQVDPWVELQRLTYAEREAFMEHLAREDPALASALVARVVRELAGPCSTLVSDADGCRYAYDDGWSEDYPDSWTLAAHPCVATDFVVGYDDLLVDADRDAVADDLVGLIGEDPGSYELLWETVAKVPVSAAPQEWIWVVIHKDHDTVADEEVRERVWQHIARAPTEARREACRHAARQRDDAEVAMRGAACLAELGDTTALPVRTPDQSIEEFAFALHMLAFDETPTAAARIATFAHPSRHVPLAPHPEDRLHPIRRALHLHLLRHRPHARCQHDLVRARKPRLAQKPPHPAGHLHARRSRPPHRPHRPPRPNPRPPRAPSHPPAPRPRMRPPRIPPHRPRRAVNWTSSIVRNARVWAKHGWQAFDVDDVTMMVEPSPPP